MNKNPSVHLKLDISPEGARNPVIPPGFQPSFREAGKKFEMRI